MKRDALPSFVKKTLEEMSVSGAGMAYTGKYAFRKPGSKDPAAYYYKMGFKPVDREALRKQSKLFDYVDLHRPSKKS